MDNHGLTGLDDLIGSLELGKDMQDSAVSG